MSGIYCVGWNVLEDLYVLLKAIIWKCGTSGYFGQEHRYIRQVIKKHHERTITRTHTHKNTQMFSTTPQKPANPIWLRDNKPNSQQHVFCTPEPGKPKECTSLQFTPTLYLPFFFFLCLFVGLCLFLFNSEALCVGPSALLFKGGPLCISVCHPSVCLCVWCVPKKPVERVHKELTLRMEGKVGSRRKKGGSAGRESLGRNLIIVLGGEIKEVKFAFMMAWFYISTSHSAFFSPQKKIHIPSSLPMPPHLLATMASAANRQLLRPAAAVVSLGLDLVCGCSRMSGIQALWRLRGGSRGW